MQQVNVAALLIWSGRAGLYQKWEEIEQEFGGGRGAGVFETIVQAVLG